MTKSTPCSKKRDRQPQDDTLVFARGADECVRPYINQKIVNTDRNLNSRVELDER